MHDGIFRRKFTGLFLFNKEEMIRGFFKGFPVILGYFPIGFAFGILATNVGMTVFHTFLMSLMVYAGSAQLIAVGLLESQVGLLTLTITTFLVNLRHLLMSAALSPSLGHLSRLQQALFSYELTDETFAVHSIDFNKEKKTPKCRIFVTNILAHLSWIVSSILGAWTGSLLSDLEAWGLDYALPAMFIALLVFQLRTMRHFFIATISLLLSTYLFWGMGGHWYVIITTLITATIGLIMEKWYLNHNTPDIENGES
ncbi:MAG: AzlC family ABC transporter permease [Bacillota bacterium]|nr:AzlC family ABC transporter permease [Bacillota bacterium]